MTLTLALLLFGVLAPALYGNDQAERDFAKITEDAEKDSLKEEFHAGNLTRRSIAAVLFTIGLTLALGFRWWFGFAYLAYFAAVFGFVFTHNLNALRRLNPWYVSLEPDAAVTDRLFVRFAPKFGTTPEALARRVYTGAVLLGIAVLGVAVWINCWK